MRYQISSLHSRAFVLLSCIVILGCGSSQPDSAVPAHDLDGASVIDVAMADLPSASEQDQFDTFGQQRQACIDLQRRARWSQALSCSQTLWDEHGRDMSVRGRVELLQLMGRIYCITENYNEAKSCYTEILRQDRYWLPQRFEAEPVEWREPIIAAYRDLDYFPGRRAEFQNLALLDFSVADLTPGEFDLTDADKALADYVTSYLQEALRDQPGGSLLRVVSYRERNQLMAELAVATGSGSGAFTADAVDAASLAHAGRLQAVQAFLQGSIVRVHDDIQVAFVITRVETGDKECGVTKSGKVDDWASTMRSALAECLECATGHAVLTPDLDSPEQLGPMQRAVAALSSYHEALTLQEQGLYGEAIAHAQEAAQLRPGVPEFTNLLRDLRYAEERVAMSDALELPAPTLRRR